MTKGAKKYALSDFWEEKGKTICEIVTESLKDKVGYMTFNEYSQIISSLREIGVVPTCNYNTDGLIDNYIKRRHKIVHEADKNINTGRGNYQTASINTRTLSAWIEAVDNLVKDIESQL